MEFWQVLVAIGIPSGIVGFAFWQLEHRIEQQEQRHRDEAKRRDEEAERRNKNREEITLRLYETSLAAIALGEATAKAVQRIPDAHCNGDMHEALNYATEVKHRQREFASRCGIESIL